MIATRSLSFAAIVCLALVVTPQCARAAFSDNFDDLLTELETRSDALSGSTDKVEKKQKKACDKAIKAIDKSNSLANDLKTAGKIAKSLSHAFSDEFTLASTTATIAPAVFVNNLGDLLTQLFDDFQSDVEDKLDELDALIADLPAGKAKTKALKALSSAQDALDQAGDADDFPSLAKLLRKALKSALKGIKAAGGSDGGGGGGGGGGGTNTISATLVIGGTNFNWSAEGGAEWVQTGGILDIGGSTNGFQVTAAQCTNFNGVAGDYVLGNNCGGVFDFVNIHFYGATAGTLHIATFDTNTTSLSGTFAYEASDGMTTIIVTNGMFDLSNMTIQP